MRGTTHKRTDDLRKGKQRGRALKRNLQKKKQTSQRRPYAEKKQKKKRKGRENQFNGSIWRMT